jgi:hypothetical protein
LREVGRRVVGRDLGGGASAASGVGGRANLGGVFNNKAANLFAVGNAAAAGLVPAQVAALTEGVIKAMFWSKVKTAAAVVLLLCLLGTGATGLVLRAKAQEQPGPKQAADERQTPQPLEERQQLEKELRELRAELKALRAEIDKLKAQLGQAEAGRKGVPAEPEGKDKLVLKVYPVGDLVSIDEADELVHVITKSIEPKNWTPRGASIVYFSKSESLVILQSPEFQERVQALLDALRKGKTQRNEKPK